MKRLLKEHKGQVFVYVAIALVVLLAMVGLAIDLGIAYGVKAKLNAAVDAAAVEAGKVISQGTSVANTKAANFFNTNYPSGFLGSTVSAPTVSSVHNADGSYDVAVNATATVPTNFARVLGFNSFTVGASATTHVRTMDMVLVIDTTTSLSNSYSPGAFTALQKAATAFIKDFDPNSYRIGLIHYAGGAVVDYNICNGDNNNCAQKSYNQNTIINDIKNMSPNGCTNSEYAMWLAQHELDSVPVANRASLRVIVFFTDGAPNTITAYYSNGVTGDLFSTTDGTSTPSQYYVYNQQYTSISGGHSALSSLPTTGTFTGTDPTTQSTNNAMNNVNLANYNTNIRPSFSYSPVNGCNANMAARNMLENVANSARSESGNNAITIFTIGFGINLTKIEIDHCSTYGTSEYGENILKRLANVSGVDTYNSNQPTGMYVPAPTPNDLGPAFEAVANQILRISK